MRRITEETGSTHGEEYGSHVDTDEQTQRKNTAHGRKGVEFPLVDLIAEADFLRALQGIFRQQVAKRTILRLRFSERFDSADEAIFKSGILLFNKACKLRIRGRTAQR